MSDLAVTGLGCVGSWGLGSAALERAWRAADPRPAALERSAGAPCSGGARGALLARELDLGGLVPAGAARRMSLPARMAVAAARLAVSDAGLEALPEEAHRRTAIVSGTAFGPATVTELLLDQIFGSGPEAASPALFAESVANAAAAQVALALRARGPNLAITGREASDLLAIAEGARLIATGAADRTLVVVVDEVSPILHAVLDRFRALARPDEAGRERARPFDRERDGALAAEGAIVVVLERADDAAARGASPYALLAARARGFDPSAPAWGYGRGGAALAAVAERSLVAAGIGRSSIGLVVSGASGSRHGDRLEASVLRSLFRDRPPAITAPKGALGGWGGGHLAAAILAAAGRPVGATAGFEHPDPELGLSPVASGAVPAPHRTLVTSLSSGGGAAWMVLERATSSAAGRISTRSV